jgi:hypothetical protein
MEAPAQGSAVLIRQRSSSVSGLVVGHIAAIDVTRAAFPSDAFLLSWPSLALEKHPGLRAFYAPLSPI